MIAMIDYATASSLQSTREQVTLGLAASRRRPLRFHARLQRDIFPFRLALQTLGELIWSDQSWASADVFKYWMLDPVITVHPDRVFFEAFSQDQSAYGLLIAEAGLFEPEGEVVCGTTNVDFTSWLWAALAEMRSSRETWFRVDAGGFGVSTAGGGGRHQPKVEIPDGWVRGFLELTAAMALPGTRLRLRPVDLLAAVRFLRFTKAKMSPRALRYELHEDGQATLVLEPWEERIALRGTEHGRVERQVIRTWGRRRLRLIEGLLPYATAVDVYLKGRAQPSFYAVKLGSGITFVLGLTGWSNQSFSGKGGDLVTPGSERARASSRLAGLDPTLVQRAEQALQRLRVLAPEGLAAELGLGDDRALASALLTRLCRRGLALYDVERREVRHRPLFETPIDEAQLFPPDPRQQAGLALVAEDRVRLEHLLPRESRKRRRLRTPDGPVERELIHRDWHLSGSAGDQARVEVVLSDEDRVIFGTCGCEFFRINLLNLGPCEHMVALVEVSASVPRPGDDASPERALGAGSGGSADGGGTGTSACCDAPAVQA